MLLSLFSSSSRLWATAAAVQALAGAQHLCRNDGAAGHCLQRRRDAATPNHFAGTQSITVSTLASALQGAKPVPLLLSIAVGAVIQFLVPVPEGVTRNAWSLLALFVSTIAGQLSQLKCYTHCLCTLACKAEFGVAC